MVKRFVRSKDDCPIVISLVTALGILLSAIVGILIWSTAFAERGLVISDTMQGDTRSLGVDQRGALMILINALN
jgi:hypothetical protein